VARRFNDQSCNGVSGTGAASHGINRDSTGGAIGQSWRTGRWQMVNDGHLDRCGFCPQRRCVDKFRWRQRPGSSDGPGSLFATVLSEDEPERDHTSDISHVFVLCISVYFCTQGELKALAGVFTISFLSVMALFAVGNILLKLKRSKLARPHRASWPSVIFGLIGVVSALVGNAILNPSYLGVFFEFLFPTFIIVVFMLGRVALFELGLFIIHSVMATLSSSMGRAIHSINKRIEAIKSQQIIFFTRGDNLANLNKAMLYIRRNEHTNRVKIVHISEENELENSKLEKDIKFLDEAYPEIDVELVIREGTFGPKLIEELSDEWNIPTNLMFIGSPGGDRLSYNLAELGGVRLII
jgi:hypothetical protein